MAMRRMLSVLAVVLAGALFMGTGVASAQSQDSDPTVQGRGWLWARGSGTATLEMGGRINLRANGDVTIVDHAGDLRLRFRNANREASQADTEATTITLENFRGHVIVAGSDFTITIEGNMTFRAKGHGKAYLEGSGLYKTRRGRAKPWPLPSDEVLSFGDAA